MCSHQRLLSSVVWTMEEGIAIANRSSQGWDRVSYQVLVLKTQSTGRFHRMTFLSRRQINTSLSHSYLKFQILWWGIVITGLNLRLLHLNRTVFLGLIGASPILSNFPYTAERRNYSFYTFDYDVTIRKVNEDLKINRVFTWAFPCAFTWLHLFWKQLQL